MRDTERPTNCKERLIPLTTPERRAVYRVDGLGGTYAIDAHFPNGLSTGIAVDLNIDGVGAVFPRAGHGSLPTIGGVGRLTLTSHGVFEPIVIGARAIHRADQDVDLCLIGFDFLTRPTLDDHHDESFNRRGAVRVIPPPDEIVDIAVEIPGYSALGHMQDVSMTGVGVVVDTAAEDKFVNHPEVDLRLDLGLPDDVVVRAAIRTRRYFDDDHVVYGLTFRSTADQVGTPTPIRVYVNERRKELQSDRSNASE